MTDTPLTGEQLDRLMRETKDAYDKGFADGLRQTNAKLREALREITKGAGEFSMDPFEHAKNCIHDMKTLARAALKEDE